MRCLVKNLIFAVLLTLMPVFYIYAGDKLTVSSATLRTRSTYRRLSSSSNVLDRFRSRSTYQGRSSRLRFSTLNEKKPPFSFSACDSRGSTAGDAQAGGIRKPAYAGSFYPADQAELSRLLERLTQEAKKNHIRLPAGKPFKALILPHAGYIYSGLTAAHASQALSGKNFTKIILLGPDHRIGFSNCAVGDADAYKNPSWPDKTACRREKTS
ncbi:MEMO1 family protein [Desulfosarcina sp. BuS5]|uniref:AmmeMemoRadiSam system protein B n=1 Tax=Desulfosarcina sp. BuS5 TaxID=933262 RepID=UPI00068449F0|nr:AmmeMemoRadiSam system protein B [Desulfosarcina sp. BuS5]WDN90117.1 MEMO1 family protein [Desulfosarcina sp. BuS5]